MPTLKDRMDRVAAALERVSESQDRTQALAERTEANLDRLSQVVNTLAESVVHHDNRVEALIAAGERHEAELRTLVREWQAYLRTIHPRQ
jgi:ABC-type transporter Mla subunit MlaD